MKKIDEKCAKCRGIFVKEKGLTSIAGELTERIKDFLRPTVKHNNNCWKVFAWFCKWPFVGNYIFSFFKIPFFLRSIFIYEYEKEDWFKKERAVIEEEAKVIEGLKFAHMDCWGDEMVQPTNPNDPARDYTPAITRKECYEKGLKPQLPEEFDFRSFKGMKKIRTEELVLCSRSKKLVPVVKCNSRIEKGADWKPVYWLADEED